MKLWLDDVREAPEGWVWVKTAIGAIHYLSVGVVKEVSLDHDLGETVANSVGNGYDVIEWIEKNTYTNRQYDPPIIYLHTANPVAFEKMIAAKESIEKEIIRRDHGG